MCKLNCFIILLLPLIFSPNGEIFRFAEGGKRRIHIADDLDDVIDDEEDEAWKQWGKKPTPSSDELDPPPSDLSNMDMSQIQELMMKQHFGPVFGFVKLRLGVRRTPDMVAEIAMKWTKVLRTGAIEVKFMGVDTSTIMLTMEKGQNMIELKEFILNQPEAYEIKIGDQVFRRPGDPPLEEVIEKLQSKKDKTSDTTTEHLKEEL
ncbi:hypothetical protein P3X46_003687 [Hevea brasiliensis]|uniref:Uncharacterized protein n=2 Tax=Hevea brasiliensis TaxID=3981 RepID=A0ABQ9NBT5_HEVBR|nr:uncharacterized protein LOC110660629 [Hevea brasiliensis]KAF2282605.1 hypothetical protein GH714_043234 [Hevea brasiliensis]KAJ9188319.1 hypothetical protein P3X46_003687 [Hevea brasiliensis]